MAFTKGMDIHFQPGLYNPRSQRGLELLGHELTHVKQQSQGRVGAAKQGKGILINEDPALEREADEQGAKAVKGAGVFENRPLSAAHAATTVPSQSGSVQRKLKRPTWRDSKQISGNIDSAARTLAEKILAKDQSRSEQDEPVQAKMQDGMQHVDATLQMKASAIQLHTIEDCNEWYEDCSDGCRRLPSRTKADTLMRALCWSRCTAEYGACLA